MQMKQNKQAPHNLRNIQENLKQQSPRDLHYPKAFFSCYVNGS